MTQEHNSERSGTVDGRAPLRECPPFETLSLYFDEELDAGEAARIAGHVAGCASCQAALRDMRLLRQALAQTTPARTQRSFRLSDADVADVRPARRPAAPAGHAERSPARRTRLLSIPFAPALAAVAALLLIAVIAGDVITRDDGAGETSTAVAGDIEVMGGTEVVVTDEDRQDSFGAASSNNMNEGEPNGNAGNEIAGSEDVGNDPFWSWWRIGELLLGAILIGLVATIILQRRANHVRA